MAFTGSHFTKTILREDGMTIIVPQNIEPELKPGEKLVHGITNIDIHFPLDGIISADIRIFPGMDSEYQVKGNYVTIDPETGFQKKVKKIEFQDGSVWEP